MKAKNLVDLGIVELDAEDYALTPEEQARENERIVNQIKADGEKIEEVDDTRLIISGSIDTETRDLAKEAMVMNYNTAADMNAEHMKDKKRRKRKRIFKSVVITLIVAFIGLALISGYEIVVPQSVIDTADGMWNSVRDFVIEWFSKR